MHEAKRREFRNIHVSEIVHYRLPLAAFVSILHRISGVILFLFLPFILCLLDHSLASEQKFAALQARVASPWIKLVIVVLVWAYLHHFCAGLRHLAMDFHWGLKKTCARQSAVSVLLISLVLAALIALKLFGVF
jgi:succinate dehydrogenase / fumarate reductase cytochrome b subunit